MIPALLALFLQKPLAGEMPDSFWVAGKSVFVVKGGLHHRQEAVRYVFESGKFRQVGSPLPLPPGLTGQGPGRNETLLLAFAESKHRSQIERWDGRKLRFVCQLPAGVDDLEDYAVVSEVQPLSVQSEVFGATDPTLQVWTKGNGWAGPINLDYSALRFPANSNVEVSIQEADIITSRQWQYNVYRFAPDTRDYSYMMIPSQWLQTKEKQEPYEVHPLPSMSRSYVGLEVSDGFQWWVAVLHLTKYWSKAQTLDVWKGTPREVVMNQVRTWQPLILDPAGHVWYMPPDAGFRKLELEHVRTVHAGD
jgi:hypothetical protein